MKPKDEKKEEKKTSSVLSNYKDSKKWTQKQIMEAEKIVLYLFIIYEKSISEKSFWKPYFNLLPKNLNTPLYYSQNELSILEGTPLKKAVDKIKKELKDIHEKVIPIISKYFLSNKDIDSSYFNLDALYWAYSVLWSRVFPIHRSAAASTHSENTSLNDNNSISNHDQHVIRQSPETNENTDYSSNSHNNSIPSLIPGADIFNHRKKSPISFITELSHSFQNKNQDENQNHDKNEMKYVFKLCTREQMNSGDQIFNNYGGKSNDALLLSYGFTVTENQDQDTHFAEIGIPTTDRLRFRKTALLSQYQIPLGHWLKHIDQYVMNQFSNDSFYEETSQLSSYLNQILGHQKRDEHLNFYEPLFKFFAMVCSARIALMDDRDLELFNSKEHLIPIYSQSSKSSSSSSSIVPIFTIGKMISFANEVRMLGNINRLLIMRLNTIASSKRSLESLRLSSNSINFNEFNMNNIDEYLAGQYLVLSSCLSQIQRMETALRSSIEKYNIDIEHKAFKPKVFENVKQWIHDSELNLKYEPVEIKFKSESQYKNQQQQQQQQQQQEKEKEKEEKEQLDKNKDELSLQIRHGIIAKQDIEAGEKICVVPQNRLLTIDNLAKDNPVGEALMQVEAEWLTPDIIAAFLLVYHRNEVLKKYRKIDHDKTNNENQNLLTWNEKCVSRMYEWDINSSLLISLENEEITTSTKAEQESSNLSSSSDSSSNSLHEKMKRYLQGTELYSETIQSRTALMSVFNVLPNLQEAFPDVFPDELFTFDAFIYAHALWDAYAIDGTLIAPFCNTRPSWHPMPNVDISVNASPHGSVEYIAQRQIKSGEEITFSYDMPDASSSELLTNVGVLPFRNIINPNDHVPLSLEVDSSEPSSFKRSSILRKFNLSLNHRLFYNSVPLSLLRTMHVLLMEAENVSETYLRVASSSSSSTTTTTETQQNSEMYQIDSEGLIQSKDDWNAAIATVRNALQERLNVFDNSSTENQASNEKELPLTERQCLWYASAFKQILNSCLSRLEEIEKDLDLK